MQFTPINSLSTPANLHSSKTQSTCTFASTSSAYPLSMVSTVNTDELPLTLSSNQAVFTSENWTPAPVEIDTFLNTQMQYEYNNRNFWQEFHSNITEDLFKEKILDCIKNNWESDPSLKQNLNNPILEIRKDIQYQLLIDILFQLKFTYFINLIVTDMLHFIQTENRINESSHLNDLELTIAKLDVKNQIFTKSSFTYNIIYKDYLNRKSENLAQDVLIRIMPILMNELQQAEKENLATKKDPSLYALALPKIESLFSEELCLDNRYHNENDEISLIINSNEIDTSYNIEALQKQSKASNETMLNSLLACMPEENIEYYDQVLFSAYKENNPLKEKYLSLTTLALQVAKGYQQIKTRIIKLILLDSTENHDHQTVLQSKGGLYSILSKMLENFLNYHKFTEELQPQSIQTPTKISISEIKKTNKEIANKIIDLKRQFARSKRKYNHILRKNQMSKADVIQKIFDHLAEQRSIEIFQEKFINLSADKIKEIIFSNKFLLQPKNNTTTDTVTKVLPQQMESDEASELEFLLANIFTFTFSLDEQVLYTVYKNDHPLKEKYLMLMLCALSANRACLQIKTRIAQLETIQLKNSDKGRYNASAVKLVKSVLCKGLTELLTKASSYYQLIEELKPSEIQVSNEISQARMKPINSTMLKELRLIKAKIRSSQHYYNKILNEKKITETCIIENIIHHLTNKEVIKTLQEKFSTLSESKVKEIIVSTKISAQRQDDINTETANASLQKRNEQENALMLESMLVNIFKSSFYYNEQLFFDAYLNNDDSKEDYLALMLTAMQAKVICVKIKTRIIQLVNFDQKKDARECDITSVKNYLYRDLAELHTTSLDYNHLTDKLKQPREQAQESFNMKPWQTKIFDKEIAEKIRQRKSRLRATVKYYNSTNKERSVEENQIIQGLLVYLTEPKAIKAIEKKFPNLTVDKINEIITRSVSVITSNQNGEAIEANSNKRLKQENDWGLPPFAKKRRTQKSKASASLSKASSTATALKF